MVLAVATMLSKTVWAINAFL